MPTPREVRTIIDVHSELRPLNFILAELESRLREDPERVAGLPTVHRQIRDLRHTGAAWPRKAHLLLSPRNWRVDQLIDEFGELQRPKACLAAADTGAGNFSVCWYPGRTWGTSAAAAARADDQYHFHRFSSVRPSFGRPANELVYIKSFRGIDYWSDFDLLGQAYIGLVQQIAGTIRHTIDVEVVQCPRLIEELDGTWTFDPDGDEDVVAQPSAW